MSTATTRKKAEKPAAASAKSIKARAPGSQMLTGQALLSSMEEYRKKVAASPESALDFLIRLGVMTPGGKPKKLIRD